MKVSKLHIDEYKVFKDFDIDFTDSEGKVQNLIVLAGINGTGKTTLLELISSRQLRKVYFDSLGDIPYIFISSISISKGEQSDQRIAQTDAKFWGSVNIQVAESEDIANRSNKLFQKDHFFYFKVAQDNTVQTKSSGAAIGYGENDKSSSGSGFGQLSPGFENSGQDYGFEIKIIFDYINKLIFDERVNPTDAYKRLGAFISNLLKDFNIGLSFTRIDSSRIAYFKNFQGKEITLHDLSTGERQLLNFALRLFIANIKDSIILIDEPEFSLHPSWQNKIVGVLQKYANEYNCQVILATHSPHIIGSVKPEQLRLLYKDENGAIKVRQYISGSYGWPVDRVLVGLMDMDVLRTPKAQKDLKELNELVRTNQYDTEEFKSKMQRLEDSIGPDDEYLTSIRFEIVKRRKEGATNS